MLTFSRRPIYICVANKDLIIIVYLLSNLFKHPTYASYILMKS
jgi:hypothetical protein